MLRRPTYDLEALRPSLDLSAVPVAAWGEPRALIESAGAADVAAPEPGATLEASSFRYVREIPADRRGLIAVSLDAAALTHSRGPAARFADVRVLDSRGRQIPYLLERRDDQLSADVPQTAAQAPPSLARNGGSRGGQSVHSLRVPYANLPPGTLLIDTPARVFRREVRLGIERPPDRQHRTPWFDVLAEGLWQHVDQQTPARPLALSLAGVEQTDLLLVVDEGDNAPLPIAGARLLLPHHRLRLFQPEGEPLRLVYGRADLDRPRYDLALLAPQVMGAPAREVAPGPEAGAPAASSGPALLSPTAFWILLGASVMVLLAIIVRLVRAS
jgi:hypothetical protein